MKSTGELGSDPTEPLDQVEATPHTGGDPQPGPAPKSRRNPSWPLVFGLVVGCGLLLAGVAVVVVEWRSSPALAPPASVAPTQTVPAAGAPVMQKAVTKQGDFVLYAPKGWTAEESQESGYRMVNVNDPNGDFAVIMRVGHDPSGGDVVALSKQFLTQIGQDYPDLAVTNAQESPQKNGIVFDATFTDPQKGPRQLRGWASVGNGDFMFATIRAPKGKLEAERNLMLTIMSNISVTKNALEYSSATQAPAVDLVTHKLSDGSASFLVPSDWPVKDYGTTSFVAGDVGSGFAFIGGRVTVLTSSMGLANPPGPVSPVLAPHDALPFVMDKSVFPNMKIDEVSPQDAASAQVSKASGQQASMESFTFTCDTADGTACKGACQGMTIGSDTSPQWQFWQLTVVAPADKFDAWAGTFAKMMGSYLIDQQWTANYVAQGQARLRAEQQRTTELISRNQEDISNMISDAYEERQTSSNYLDYQWTNYMRGQEDWVSSTEGGTVYHTDSWGTQNTATGEYTEGQPYNYVNSTGENPNTGEQMTPIDSAELWQANIK